LVTTVLDGKYFEAAKNKFIVMQTSAEMEAKANLTLHGVGSDYLNVSANAQQTWLVLYLKQNRDTY
jgi:hypothetical protein